MPLPLVIELGRAAFSHGNHIPANVLACLLRSVFGNAPENLGLTTTELACCLERGDWRRGLHLCRHLRFVVHELDADINSSEWATWVGQAQACLEYSRDLVKHRC